MRVEIDRDLGLELNKIKTHNWIAGKGHTETIRWLVEYQKTHRSLEELLEKHLSQMETKLENSVLKAFRRILNNILGGSS